MEIKPIDKKDIESLGFEFSRETNCSNLAMIALKKASLNTRQVCLNVKFLNNKAYIVLFTRNIPLKNKILTLDVNFKGYIKNKQELRNVLRLTGVRYVNTSCSSPATKNKKTKSVKTNTN